MRFAALLLPLLTLLTGWADASDYSEHLLLKPLPQSALLAAFDFRSNTTESAFQQQNYRLFPRSLGQILQHAHAKELHLRFALGRWDAHAWGARPRGGASEGGTGVELWAWVEADTDEEANARWLTLANALSGLFCASLNFIDSTKTIRPVSSFEMEGTRLPSSNLHLLHGALPHEVVCTENLTPFLKLLPCKAKAGISSLLDGHKLFDASWQTMAIDVRHICPSDGGECLVQIQQTVDMVVDIERSMRPANDPIPRPLPIETIPCNTSKPYNGADTCFPTDMTESRPWSLKDVFGRPIRGACPLDDADAQGAVELQVSPETQVEIHAMGRTSKTPPSNSPSRRYHLHANEDFDLVLSPQALTSPQINPQPRLYAQRGFTGYGQERGGVSAVLINPSPTGPVDLIYLESLPWFMKPYLHTLRATITTTNPNPNNSTTDATSTSAITSILYRPGIDRSRGAHLELSITVPAAATVTLAYDFDKAILRYTEYPPDANRGFDVAPAIIRLLPPRNALLDDDEQRPGQSTYLRTTSLLLPLPTPDFSMPYNVIILTSTVIAMGFGSIFNLLVRRFIAADEVEGRGGLKGRVVQLRTQIKERVARIRARFMEKGGREKKVQ